MAKRSTKKSKKKAKKPAKRAAKTFPIKTGGTGPRLKALLTSGIGAMAVDLGRLVTGARTRPRTTRGTGARARRPSTGGTGARK